MGSFRFTVYSLLLSLSLICAQQSACAGEIQALSGTWIRSDQPDTIGDNTAMLVGYDTSGPRWFHGLMEFNVSGLTGTVTSASLIMKKSWGNGSMAGISTMEVFEVLSSFNGYRVAERATWNHRSTSPLQAWNISGANGLGTDRSATRLAWYSGDESTTANGTQMTFASEPTFLALIQSAIGGTVRLFLNVAGDPATHGKKMWGMGGPYSGTISDRPTLLVTLSSTPSIILDKNSTTLSENGGIDTVLVSLSTAPTNDVVLTVSSEDISRVSATPPQLLFNATNWNTAQSVLISGVDDASMVSANDIDVRVSVDAFLSDGTFSVTPSSVISVTLIDDEQEVDQTIFVDSAAAGGGDGSPSSPYNTLGAALVYAQGQGNRVKIKLAAGTYREGGLNLMNRSLLTIIEGSTSGESIVSGSDIWTGWSFDGTNYFKAWTPNWGLETVRPEASVRDEGKRSEMVFINGVLMRQVTAITSLTSHADFGTYFVDEAGDKLYLRPPTGVDPNGSEVEVAVRRNLLQLYQNNNIVLRNLVFQHSAAADHSTWPHTFAVAIAGGNDGDPLVNPNPDGSGYTRQLLVDACTFRWNNSEGLHFNLVQHFRITRSRFLHNGKGGMGSNRSRYGVWEDCTFAYNNWRWGLFGGEYGWAPAGVKALKQSDVLVKGCRFIGNYAAGLWFDYGNENLTVEECLSVHNWGAGVYYEASLGPLALSRCLIRNNGIVPEGQDEFWASGLLFAESFNLSVNNSYLIDNNYAQLDVRSSARLSTMYWSGQTFDGLSRDWSVDQSVLTGNRNETKFFPTNWITSFREAAIYAPSPTGTDSNGYKNLAIPSFSGAGNQYYQSSATKAFHPGLSTNPFYREPLANWQAATSSDIDAAWSSNALSRSAAFDFFTGRNGVMVIEAENSHTSRQRGDSEGWKVRAGYDDLTNGVLGALGTGYLLAGENIPSTEGAFSNATRVTYRVNVTEPTNYWMNARRYALDMTHDSAWIGVNGTQVGEISGSTTGWQWSAPVTLGFLTEGVHELSLVRRDAGLRIDRFAISDNPSSLLPDGDTQSGPQESDLRTPAATANEVTVLAVDSQRMESDGTAVLRFVRNFQSGDLTVYYALSGTAQAGSDYIVPSGSIIISNGTGFADVVIPLVDDTNAERDETITATLLAGSGYSPGAPNNATVTILANDLVAQRNISVLQPESSTQTVWLTLHNPYDTPLTFNLSDGAQSSLNYVALTSDDPGGPPYQWTESGSAGTRLTSLDGWDGAATTITLPFPFTHYGVVRNQIQVSVNGLLQAPQGSSNDFNWPLPYQYGQGAIAPLWDDLQNLQGIFTYSPDSDTFIVQWNNSLQKSSGQSLTFQVHLKRSGEMLFYYKKVNGISPTYTVGTQNGTFDILPDLGLQLAYNEALLKSNFAVRIYSPPHWLTSVATNNAVVVPAGATLDAAYRIETGVLHEGQEFTEHLTLTTSQSLAESFPVTITVSVDSLATNMAEAWLWENFSTTIPYGLASWDADPDNDGQKNVAEYILLTNPNLEDQPGCGIDLEMGAGTPRVHFYRRRGVNLSIEVLEAVDLMAGSWSVAATLEPESENWTEISSDITETNLNSEAASVFATFPHSISSFLHLRIEVPARD